VLQSDWSGQAVRVSKEVVITLPSVAVVGFLKRAEQEDFYDTDTNFTPCSLQD